jgi:type III secretory pathway lipoprotein EscJ
MRVFSQSGLPVDKRLQPMFEDGLISAPTTEALKAKMGEALAYRMKTLKEVDGQEARYVAIEKFTSDASPSRRKLTVLKRALSSSRRATLSTKGGSSSLTSA